MYICFFLFSSAIYMEKVYILQLGYIQKDVKSDEKEEGRGGEQEWGGA